MTSLWRTFFKRIPAGPLANARGSVPARLSRDRKGAVVSLPTIVLLALLIPARLPAAAVTAQVELADSREPSVRKQKDYSGVVVWLEPAAGSAAAPASRRITMLQKGKRFIPHVLVVPVGSTVDFPNSDPIFHNAFSNFSGQPFDTGLYPPGTSQRVTFRRAGVVRVFCNIHSNMSAVIVVVNTPYYGTSDRAGNVRIENVPPGEYQLRVWHERTPEDKLRGLGRAVTVGSSDTAIPLLHISESGYLELPHKNKYGKEYPPVPNDRVVYPEGKKE